MESSNVVYGRSRRHYLKPSAIDVFCGAGGLSVGLRDAGFRLVAAVDNDPIAAKTYAHNLGDHVLKESIDCLSVKSLLKFAGLRPGQCDLFAGGPPCQGFSIQRRGNHRDARNSLMLDYLRLLEGVRPKFFMLENVRGLMSKRGRPFLERVIKRAQKIGYVVQVKAMNAADYGVPQDRDRLIVVGELTSSGGASHFTFPPPLFSRSDYRTVRAAIGDMPVPPLDGTPHPGYPLHYREARLSQINLKRIQHVREGNGRDDLPRHLQLPCHLKNPSHRHKDVYGRMAWDQPSPTITARFDSFTRGRFGHPVDHRTVTLREGARLQSFTDEFHFFGNREEVARQIGNAVPPLLARIIGRRIFLCLALAGRSERHMSDKNRGRLRQFRLTGTG